MFRGERDKEEKGKLMAQETYAINHIQKICLFLCAKYYKVTNNNNFY